MTTFQILEQFCEIVQGGRHKLSGNDFVKSGYPAYGAGGMNGYLATFEFDESAVILSSIGARCGKCFYVEGRWSSLANTQVIFPDKNECDAKFLWYQLNDEKRWPRAGTGQPFIKPSDVKRHKVFLPPIEEQRRIAAILDQAETLRTQRRTALALLDSLTQSLFLDMFGDPVANPKGLPICELQRLCTRITDGTHQSPAWQKSGIPFLFISNIVEGQINFDTHKFISADTHAELTKRCPIEIGDVLYTTVGSYGNAAVVSTKELFAFQRHIAHIKPDRSKLDSRFLAAMIQSPGVRQQVDKVAKGIAQKTVNLADLKGLSVFWPPLPLQQIFATRIASIEALKATHRRALAALDALFASLQQRAFTGAL